MKMRDLQKNRGFVILFAITISSILLAIALGVGNIALKEMKFSTNARDTNDAFLAADTGIEKALFDDKAGDICTPAPCGSPLITISQLGSAGQNCVKVTVNKTVSPAMTTIISKGYNAGGSVPGSCNPPSNSIERELKVTYGDISSPSPPAGYRYVRWIITKKKTAVSDCGGAGNGCVQVSELVLLQNESPVSWPGATSVINPGGNNPVGETPPNLKDGDIGTKWLDFNFAGVDNQNGSSVLIFDTGFGNSVNFNGYRWTTANDEPSRDPISWTLEGSNNGSNWIILDSRSNQIITNSRQTSTSNYSF